MIPGISIDTTLSHSSLVVMVIVSVMVVTSSEKLGGRVGKSVLHSVCSSSTVRDSGIVLRFISFRKWNLTVIIGRSQPQEDVNE